MSVDPAAGATVAYDQSVRVHGVLHYQFAAATAGHVGVTVIAAAGGTLAYVDAGILADVNGREGQVPADVTFRLPAGAAGGGVTVRWSLVVDGASTASAEVGVDYRVAS